MEVLASASEHLEGLRARLKRAGDARSSFSAGEACDVASLRQRMEERSASSACVAPGANAELAALKARLAERVLSASRPATPVVPSSSSARGTRPGSGTESRPVSETPPPPRTPSAPTSKPRTPTSRPCTPGRSGSQTPGRGQLPSSEQRRPRSARPALIVPPEDPCGGENSTASRGNAQNLLDWANQILTKQESAQRARHRADAGGESTSRDNDVVREAMRVVGSSFAEKLRQQDQERQDVLKGSEWSEFSSSHDTDKEFASWREKLRNLAGAVRTGPLEFGTTASRAPLSHGTEPVSARELRTTRSYEDRWREFEEKVGSGAIIEYSDIPWPDHGRCVCGATTMDDARTVRRKIHHGIRRWHPDKWVHILEQVPPSQKGRVLEEVKRVAQRIVDEKESLWK
mmetsp:Transcript_14379/g.31781  ORF Transcript_14379/g.31781 Transcript_14379/m.31781 type:complete len:403 (-) Transcript_14379:106-1314(-)